MTFALPDCLRPIDPPPGHWTYAALGILAAVALAVILVPLIRWLR